MCVIVGYIGFREAYPIVIKGLKRLEYRGYDSAGIMLYADKEIKIAKTKGKVSDLEEAEKILKHALYNRKVFETTKNT